MCSAACCRVEQRMFLCMECSLPCKPPLLKAAALTKDQILARLDAAWRDFEASYAGLTSSQMLIPSVTGAWSVRDIIAHVTWWEEEALNHLPLIRDGGRPPRYSVKYGGIN